MNIPLYISGVFNTEGPSWKEQRRFMISTLRDFGMGKQTLEYKIQEEICALKDELKEQNGNAMNIRLLMNTTVSNIICSILIGHRFAYDDPEFKSNLEKLNTMFERAHFLLLGEKLAFLRNLPGDPIKVRRGFLLFVEKLAFLRNLPGDPIKVSRRFLLLRGKLDFLQNLPGDPIKVGRSCELYCNVCILTILSMYRIIHYIKIILVHKNLKRSYWTKKKRKSLY